MAPSNTPPFSWTKPHPQFVIVLVGPEETPFSLHKDFLCAQSSYYRKHFATQADAVEAIVKLPDTSTEVFGFAQHFMYTDAVFPEDTEMPSYEALVGLWKLGHDLGIEGLCDRTLETMKEVQEATGKIPGPPLLVQVWRDAPEGSTIRGLLLHWAADYMRSSKSNAEFAKSLPQEVLSELVLAMSRPDTTPLVQLGVVDGAPPAPPVLSRRKMVHYLDEEEQEELEPAYAPIKKQRRPELFVNAPAAKAVARKAKPAPVAKPVPRRRSNPVGNGETQEFTAEQKLAFCSDLLGRMLSGPGELKVQTVIPSILVEIPTRNCILGYRVQESSKLTSLHQDFGLDLLVHSEILLIQCEMESLTTLRRSQSLWISSPSRTRWTAPSTPAATSSMPT